jgi:hypothetical protein
MAFYDEFLTLSGQVGDLQSGFDAHADRLTALEGQILSLPTNSDITNFTQLLAGRLNTLETVDSTQTTDITALLQSFSYLKDTILGIDTNLEYHTGLYTGDGDGEGAHSY